MHLPHTLTSYRSLFLQADLPSCDLYIQAEISGAWRSFDDPARYGGAATGLRHHVRGEWPLFYGDINTGVMMFRPTLAATSLISVARRYFPLSDGLDTRDPFSGRERPRGDQASLSMLLASRYRLAGVKNVSAYDTSQTERGHAFRAAMRRGRCMRLEKVSDDDDSFPWKGWLSGTGNRHVEALVKQLPQTLDMWILNPGTF